MNCELSSQEWELVNDVLMQHQDVLLRDISKTDHYEYRKMLKSRLETLQGILEKLSLNKAA